MSVLKRLLRVKLTVKETVDTLHRRASGVVISARTQMYVIQEIEDWCGVPQETLVRPRVRKMKRTKPESERSARGKLRSLTLKYARKMRG